MTTLFATDLPLTLSERAILERLVRGAKTPQRQAQRARLLLLMADGLTNPEAAEVLGVEPKVARLVRSRWLGARAGWAACQDDPKALAVAIQAVLRGKVASGRPPTFTPEQIAAILALACEKPEETGLPFTHWTCTLLAEEAVRRGIVDHLSRSSVGRFLKGRRIRAAPREGGADGGPHRPARVRSAGRKAV